MINFIPPRSPQQKSLGAVQRFIARHFTTLTMFAARPLVLPLCHIHTRKWNDDGAYEI